MALVVTPGAADADSYATLAEALAYNAARLHSGSWTAAGVTDAIREAALKQAATLLDANPRAWTGAAISATQALGWPRSGMLNRNGFAIAEDAIPRELKYAQSEFARQLIDADRTADNDVVDKAITSISAGSVSLGFADVSTTNAILTGRTVREMTALAAVLPDAVKYLLVVSWLLPDAEDALLVTQRSLFLEVY